VIKKSDPSSEKDSNFYAEDNASTAEAKENTTVDYTGDYLSVGTYCSVLYNQQNPRKITLKGIHRVDISKITGYDLKDMFVELQQDIEEAIGTDKQSSLTKVLDEIEDAEEDQLQDIE